MDAHRFSWKLFPWEEKIDDSRSPPIGVRGCRAVACDERSFPQLRRKLYRVKMYAASGKERQLIRSYRSRLDMVDESKFAFFPRF